MFTIPYPVRTNETDDAIPGLHFPPQLSRQLPLFVYGTLRNGERNHYVIRNAIQHSEPAFANGLSLHALPTYPVAVHTICLAPESTIDALPVYGELFTIRPYLYHETLQYLDEFEGFYGETSFYHRRAALVETLDGALVEAWIYVGNPTYASDYASSLILHGDWTRYQRELLISETR